MDNITDSEQKRLQLILDIQQLIKEGYSYSEIGRRLGKDRRTIKRYAKGNPYNLCKDTRKRTNPYEERVISLVKQGYIQKEIIDILKADGYTRTVSNTRYMINKVIRDNQLVVNKYRSILGKSQNHKITNKQYIYIKRARIFEYLWMDSELTEKIKDYLLNFYPNVFELYRCIIEFRDMYRKKSVTHLHLFIDKYKNSNIGELSSFAKGLLKDLDAVENSVSSNLSNGFVEGTNNKLKMIKRSMYGRCSIELLTAKLVLSQ